MAPEYKDIGKRMRGIPMLVDLDVRFRVMDGFDGYEQILSLPTPPHRSLRQPGGGGQSRARANDGMAELVNRYPRSLPRVRRVTAVERPRRCAPRLRRAIDDLGARGFQIFSNIGGKPIVAPEFVPLFEMMAARDLPIWLHPYRGADFSGLPDRGSIQSEIWWTFGWPYETSVAMARLVFAGYFDRWPASRSSRITWARWRLPEGRVGPGWDQLGARTSDADYAGVLRT